ncbi:MAG: hypothetical protein E7129_06440, partial [Rikenellaceae bacterium]|nr:hypothetical protein [Rikenellaceae bacterium]
KVDGKANIDAEFALNAGKEEYKYVAVYPKAGFDSADNINAAVLALPSEQSAVAGSYDPNADLMVSMPVETDVQPTEAQPMRFTRLAAVVEMSINNLTLAADEVVECVEFTANGKALAGTITADLENPHEFTVKEGVSTVSVATTSATKVYFTVLPTELAAGDTYSVAVLTNKQVFIKQGEIPADKSLVFEAGKVSRFGVNMTDAGVADKWKLVRDTSTLKEGDIVAIVAKDYDKALSTKLYSNASETAENTRRDATDITKLANYLIGNENVQQLILVTGVADNTFSFYDEARKKFLVSNNKTSRYLINQPYMNSSTSFNISIDGTNGDATIKNVEGDYKDCMIRYYNSSKYFYSGTSANQAVCIYRLEGAEGAIPTVDANVAINVGSDEFVTIAEDGEESAKTIEEVVFNYVGDWTIVVSDNADWLEVVYNTELNVLTYTSQRNTSTDARDAIVTLKATREGKTLELGEFNIKQKGAPEEISIVEFATKGQDVDTVYKLIGIIKEIPSSTSGKFKLADENGNTAQVQYLKTEAGAYVKGNIDIKVGDVISLTTVVAGTTVGLGGNSTYPSIYKGHYSIAATASGSVEYLGGDVTINVNVVKNGHIVAPTTISSGEVATDDNPINTYNFTDNGDGTATAVVTFGENTTGGSRKANLTFSAGSPLEVSTTISVMQDVNPALKKGWWLVTDVNDLAAGDEIIIAATGLDYAINTGSSGNTRSSTAITKVGGALENVSSSVQVYALEIDANGLYSFKGTLGDGANKYIYASSSSSNYMKVTSTLDDNGKFTIEIASDGAATVIAQGENTRNHMQYNNKASSSPTFYCTNGSFGAVCFYKNYK